jgi:zinc/manganese transport system substrate-binding protein
MSFKKTLAFIFLVVNFSVSLGAETAPLKVVTSLPALAWVVERVGGDEVVVESLLRGSEDPHFVDAKPSFVKKAADADMLCFVGLSLEVGWLPKVLERSANPKIQESGSGYCDLGQSVVVLEKLAEPLDRSHGHIHSDGNPHWYLSLQSLSEASEAVLGFLQRLRPESSEDFKKRQLALKNEIQKTLKDSQNKIQNSVRLLEYHKEFAYLLRDLGVNSKGSVEEKPGVPPSAAAIARVRRKILDEQIDLILATEAQSEALLKKVSSGTPAHVLQVEPMPSLKLNPLAYHEKVLNSLLSVKQN